MKTALVFLNGKKPTERALRSIDYGAKLVVCADGALNYLHSFAVPDILVGDFDSINGRFDLPPSVKIKAFNPDKDFTDGFLAVRAAVEAGADCLEIYGALGARPDHCYNNYALLSLADNLEVGAVLKDGRFEVRLVKDELSFESEKGKTVSIVPFGDKAHILYTRGLRFPADNLIFDRINPMNSVEGVSNEATGGIAEIKVKSGRVLVFIEI